MLSYKEALRRQAYWEKWFEFVAFVLGSVLLWMVFTDAAGRERETPWKRFVQVDGQPEPVPEQWLATPEGRFAHSIRLPNPVPKDSGYRRGMTSEQYFEHLCRTEAGEFIFKTVDDVEGFYFMRPPGSPRDVDLKDRFALEAPEIERSFQLMRSTPIDRAKIFVNPPWAAYKFVEEPDPSGQFGERLLRASGYRQRETPMQVEVVRALASGYGMTWRGLKRPQDRELAVAGSELIVIDVETQNVLAIQRNFALTGRTRNAPGGIWWLNAIACPSVGERTIHGIRYYRFLSRVLKAFDGSGK